MDYRTEDGSANAGSDYEYSEGTLVFKPGETRKDIKVNDGDEQEDTRDLDRNSKQNYKEVRHKPSQRQDLVQDHFTSHTVNRWIPVFWR